MIKDTLKLSYPEVFELYDKVIDWEYVRNKDIYEQVNAEYIPYEENEELQQLTEGFIKQSNDELRNITQSMGFYLDYGNGKLVMTPLADVYQDYLEELEKSIQFGKIQEKIYGYFTLSVGKPAKLIVCSDTVSVEAESEIQVEQAGKSCGCGCQESSYDGRFSTYWENLRYERGEAWNRAFRGCMAFRGTSFSCCLAR